MMLFCFQTADVSKKLHYRSKKKKHFRNPTQNPEW